MLAEERSNPTQTPRAVRCGALFVCYLQCRISPLYTRFRGNLACCANNTNEA